MAGLAPIVVLGATGFTGQLIVQSLERMKRPYVVAGRRQRALEAVAGPRCQGLRIANVLEPETLRAAMEGMGAIIQTVGPFATHGRTVLEAAIDTGCHYTDISAEQGFLRDIAELDELAIGAGITAIAGNGADFGFAYLGAAIADAAVGGATHMVVHQWMQDFKPSRGTAESAIAAMKSPNLVLRDGILQRRHDFGVHRKLVQNLDGWGVPWSGAEPVTLPRDFPKLRNVECYLVLSRAEAIGFAAGGKLGRRMPQRLLNWASHQARGMPEIDAEDRRKAAFTVLVEAEAEDRLARFRVDAHDVYGTTADLAAVTAAHLADGRARLPGVRTTGVALDPHQVLADLESRGVTATLPAAP